MRMRNALWLPAMAWALTAVSCGSPQGLANVSHLACAKTSCNHYSTTYEGRALGQSGTDANGKLERDIGQLVNAERAKQGLGALRIVSYATAAAQKHSIDQATTLTMAHELYGKDVGDRMHDEGYQWQAVGENVAYGQRTAAEVMASWMASPGHRANILGSMFDSLGVGVQRGTDGNLYFTQVFAKPMSDVYN